MRQPDPIGTREIRGGFSLAFRDDLANDSDKKRKLFIERREKNVSPTR